jgi:hypothetical protein
VERKIEKSGTIEKIAKKFLIPQKPRLLSPWLFNFYSGFIKQGI